MEFEERSDYPEWKALQDWYETSMRVYMLNFLWSYDREFVLPYDEAYWFDKWWDDVDMCTGAFGK